MCYQQYVLWEGCEDIAWFLTPGQCEDPENCDYARTGRYFHNELHVERYDGTLGRWKIETTNSCPDCTQSNQN